MRCRCRRRAIKRETGLPSQSPAVTAPPKGEPLAGRAALNWTPEAQCGAKGRALLQRAAASGQRTLSSCRESRHQGTTVFEISSFAHSVQALPTRQWLPLWGNNDDRRQWRKQGVVVGAAASKTRAMRSGCWEPQPGLAARSETERARTLKEKMNE